MLVSSKIIIIIAHLSVLCLGSGRQGYPGYVYHPQLHGYLKLHKEPAKWLAARLNCHNEEALLTSPWTADFTSAVHDLQWNEEKSLPVLFSGALETFPEGSYRSNVERLPGVLINLDKCGVFFSNRTTGDVDCRLQFPYVCYAPSSATSEDTKPKVTTPKDTKPEVTTPKVTTPKVTTPKDTTPKATTPKVTTPTVTTPKDSTSEDTTTDDTAPEYTTPEYTTPASTTLAPTPNCEGSGYEFSNLTKRCYKFHTDRLPWSHANSNCMAEGGTLVIINSYDEAKVLVDIFKHHPVTSFPKDKEFYRNFISIGIYWESGVWKTIDGQTLEQAGYANWVPGLPRDDVNYPYGVMNRDGGLGNGNEYWMFICEKGRANV